MNLRSQCHGFYFLITVTLIFACGVENFAEIRNLYSAGESIICPGDSPQCIQPAN